MHTVASRTSARAIRLSLGLSLAFSSSACSSSGSEKDTSTESATDTVAPTAPTAKPANPAGAVLVKVPAKEFVHGGDEAAALGALHALPAWSAVIERDRFLARRGDGGVVYGVLVEDDGGYLLADESQGEGTLAIPIDLPEALVVEMPRRVVAWGAWELDDEQWRWQSTQIELLEPKPALAFGPGLVAREKTSPEGLQPISSLPRRGGALHFKVLERGEQAGDGWIVGDPDSDTPVARLLLPGERAPYGDQSVIGESERWQLEPGTAYWIETGRRRSGAQLPSYRAEGPPFHLPPPEG